MNSILGERKRGLSADRSCLVCNNAAIVNINQVPLLFQVEIAVADDSSRCGHQTCLDHGWIQIEELVGIYPMDNFITGTKFTSIELAFGNVGVIVGLTGL